MRMWKMKKIILITTIFLVPAAYGLNMGLSSFGPSVSAQSMMVSNVNSVPDIRNNPSTTPNIRGKDRSLPDIRNTSKSGNNNRNLNEVGNIREPTRRSSNDSNTETNPNIMAAQEAKVSTLSDTSCRTYEGREYEQGEPGYDDCARRIRPEKGVATPVP